MTHTLYAYIVAKRIQVQNEKTAKASKTTSGKITAYPIANTMDKNASKHDAAQNPFDDMYAVEVSDNESSSQKNKAKTPSKAKEPKNKGKEGYVKKIFKKLHS
jgi:hypothetical protein